MNARAQQRGAVLVIGLLLLSVLALVALTGARSARLEERIGGNLLAGELAFHAAAGALADAARRLEASERTGSPPSLPIQSSMEAGIAAWDCAGAGLGLTEDAPWTPIEPMESGAEVGADVRVVRLAPDMTCGAPEPGVRLYLVVARGRAGELPGGGAQGEVFLLAGLRVAGTGAGTHRSWTHWREASARW